MVGDLALVAQQAEHADADIGSPPEDPQHLGGGLASADDERVPLVVAVPARQAQALAKEGAGEAGGDDRLDPEKEDHDP